MKRRWKQICSLFLAVCMVITMLPMTAFAETGSVSGTMYIDGDVEYYNLAKDAGDIASRGWAWDATTATLTLAENYEGYYIEIRPEGENDEITLVYTGDVTITPQAGYSNGLECTGSLAIDGSGGTLSLESSYHAISVTKNLTIEENASVVATGESYAISCQGNLNLRGSLIATSTVPDSPVAIDIDLPSVLDTNGNLTTNGKVNADMIVNDGTVNITGDLSGNLTVSAGQVTVTGDVGGDILNTGGTVWVNGEQIFAPALFLDASETGANPFHLGKIDGPRADNLSGYTWDGETKTLTLSGLTYKSSGEAALRIQGADIEIVLADDSVNSIICANTKADSTYGISSNNTITFSGKGSLVATVGTSALNSYGIYAEFRDIIIEGGIITATGGTSAKDSYGMYASMGITVEGGTITATGGTSADESCGIYANQDIIVEGGNIAATGGTSNGESYGIYANQDIIVKRGTLTAIGGGG